MTRCDEKVVVIGLGAMGSAVLYQLARLGTKALGIDRFAPPHAMGSSHGETRITRQAVGEGAQYMPLVTQSHAIWRDLQKQTGERLFVECGTLIIAPGSAPSSHHGKPNFVDRSACVAKRCGIPHEVLRGDEIRRRFPVLIGVQDDDIAYFEPGGGFVIPESCVSVQLARAEDMGATTRTGEAVRAIRQVGDIVEIETKSGTLRAERAVVAAGPWNGPLLGAPFDRLLIVKRQVLHWFETDDPTDQLARLPVLIWMHGATDVDHFYGFPPLDGARSMKVATEQYETAADPDALDRVVHADEPSAMYTQHLQGRVDCVVGTPVKSAVCAYTVTPDQGFIIDTHPQMNRVTVISACSGHGFKHSAGIGRAVAQWLVQGRSDVDLAPFSLSRFASLRPPLPLKAEPRGD
ncbi:MAG: N-methyl-L-tryptophan oxidase [Variovorax sp.]